MKRKLSFIAAALAFCLLVSACGREEPDPHEGMVLVNTGGAEDWIYPAEGVPVSGLDAADFALDERGRVVYTGTAYSARTGIDVSFYQGEIDWEAVAADGIDFVMIRCGYRGSSEGTLMEDEKFRDNMEGALAAGLDVGVYFFSQALGAAEAAEEALFTLGLIEGYELSMPVAFDWEPLDGGRSQGLGTQELTEAAEVFCKIIEGEGYEPCVYLYRALAYYKYELAQLAEYPLWVGAPGEKPDFYYEQAIWQYSFTARVAGIDHDVDLNLEFTALPAE